MKKILIVIFYIIFTSMMVLSTLAVSDTTPPELTSISISSKSLSGGDNLTFTISGSDDLSGIGHIMIEYQLKTDNTKKISIEFDNNSSSNSFKDIYKIPEKTVPGEWEAFAIQVWDTAGNLQTYFLWNTYDDDIIHFNNINFTIKEKPGADITPPELKSISVKNKTITAPGKIEITAVATDNISSTVKIQVSYLICESQHSVNLSKTSENTYTGSLSVEANAKYQTVKLAFIILEDDAGNQAWYSYDPSEYPFGDSSLKLNTNIDISFSNGISDEFAPRLISYNYSNSSVTAPGVANIIFDAQDSISGVASIKAHFKGFDENGTEFAYWILNPQYDAKSKKFVSEHAFDQYYPNATFFITKIELVDNADNISVYAINPQLGELKLTKKTLTLTKAITGDVAAGTMNDNYIDTIKSAKDGDVITLDCTKNSTIKKEAFDAIKGTNKTLILANDGIQWIFKGVDISETTKDINTNIKIGKLDDSGNEFMLECFIENSSGLVIEFAPNGVLPGKALVKIKADYALRNFVGEKDLYIYHYQDTANSLEAIANRIEITEDGYFEFYISHNSKYIISSKKAKADAIKKDSSVLNASFTVEPDNKDESTISQEESTSSDEATSSSETTSLPETTSSPDEVTVNNQNHLVLFVILTLLGISLIILAIVFHKPILSKLSNIKKEQDNKE